RNKPAYRLRLSGVAGIAKPQAAFPTGSENQGSHSTNERSACPCHPSFHPLNNPRHTRPGGHGARTARAKDPPPPSAPVRNIMLDNDPLWYKDAILYEVHVRAFH